MTHILLVEPYFAGSHRSWAEGYAAHSRHQIHLVTHPGRHWKWRMQGGALTLAAAVDEHVAAHGRPDVLLASDMVHLPALLGLARRSLRGVPVALYLHENQLTYPLPAGTPPDHTYAMANWLSMAAADLVAFNSDYHRRDVTAALPRFLSSFPDQSHQGNLAEVLERCTTLPVGVEVDRFTTTREQAAAPASGPPVVLWNHRWEYDKDPGAFARALHTLADRDVDFRLSLIGPNSGPGPDEPGYDPERTPRAFAQLRERFGDRIITFGTATPDEYATRLGEADVVVSTARHEFFGVSVVEAVAAGAFPLLPDRLNYPELVPAPADRFLYRGPDELVDRLAWVLTHSPERRALAAESRAFVRRFAWEQVAPRYDDLLQDLATRH